MLITTNFPNAKIVLTGYYNPFPGPVTDYSQTCPLYSAIPAAALVNEVGWYALAFALDSGQFYPFVVRVQTLVYNTIGRLVSRLNRVIDSAAHANGAVQLAGEETSGFLDCARPSEAHSPADRLPLRALGLNVLISTRLWSLTTSWQTSPSHIPAGQDCLRLIAIASRTPPTEGRP